MEGMTEGPNDGGYDLMTEGTTQRRRVRPNDGGYDGAYDPTKKGMTQRPKVWPNDGGHDPTMEGRTQ